MKIPITLKVLFVGVAAIEKTIEKLLEWLADCKEGLLIPLVRKFWPRWFSPNQITALRFAISLYVIWYLCRFGRTGYEDQVWFAGLIIFACLTDLFDGPVARALNKESRFGSLLDKIVDKFLILPLGVVEFWPMDKALVILSIAGAVVVVIVAAYKYYQGKSEVPENIFGKVGMICYSLGIILAIWPDWQVVAWRVAWTGFAFGLSSVILNFRRHFGFPGPHFH